MALDDRRLAALAAAPKLDLLGRCIDRCDANDPVLIPRIDEWHDPENLKLGPGWSGVYRQEGDGQKVYLKPHIRCKCGAWTGIGLHTVHADGRVTASFFDATAEQLAAMGEQGKRFTPGCGWHVFIKLAGYTYGPFPSEP